MIKEFADKVLDELDSICKELNLTYLLTYGTCLGFFRDGDYIEGDNDIDIGVKCFKDEYKKLAERLIRGGYRGIIAYGHFFKYNILLDIHLPNELRKDGVEQLEIFDKVTHSGRVYNVPHPIKEYLDVIYKGEWRIRNRRQ